MSAQAQSYKDRHLIATIGDEDTITGLLLAGTGQVSQSTGKKNFLIVDSSTSASTVESTFQEYTERNDIAIVLINQHVAEMIRPSMEAYTLPFPAILGIPSKTKAYDPSKDAVLKKVRKLRGE